MQRKIKVHYPKPRLIAWFKELFPEVDWSPVEAELPPIIWRHRWNQIAEKCGLPYTRFYMEKLDSLGKGPNSIAK